MIMATSVLARPGDRVLSEVIARVSDLACFAVLQRQGERCGWCSHPIRLVGSSVNVNTSTGEILRSYSTNDEPEGVLMKACGTRRATRCPSCASLYASDARMLVRAGLSGGKGVPESVAQRPMVFATFTAPSFGAVHGARGTKPCRAGTNQQPCAHGRSLTCQLRHRADDPLLGQPICPDCYDYERSVLWNATCPELWRRTTIPLCQDSCRL